VIVYINGPVVKASNEDHFKMREMVLVGDKQLIGEVVSIDGDTATIQVKK
jgi:V/A-type H+-transporting ATPase subunit A